MPSKTSKKVTKKTKAAASGARAASRAVKPKSSTAKQSAAPARKKAAAVTPAGKRPAAESKPASPARGTAASKHAAVSKKKSSAPTKAPVAAPVVEVAAPAAADAGKKAVGKEMGGQGSSGHGSSGPPRSARKPKLKSKIQMPVDPLFKPGAKWKPLIPSGPNAAPTGLVGHHSHGQGDNGRRLFKTTLTKRELDQYRKILLQKRAELVGDIRHMEDEALRQSGSGSLSQTPQHMADQGSDTFEQSLSLDLAAVDRNLIREIDDALKRIDDGSYGMCERTGKAINPMRLSELPWARYSIEAARELERRPYQE